MRTAGRTSNLIDGGRPVTYCPAFDSTPGCHHLALQHQETKFQQPPEASWARRAPLGQAGSRCWPFSNRWRRASRCDYFHSGLFTLWACGRAWPSPVR